MRASCGARCSCAVAAASSLSPWTLAIGYRYIGRRRSDDPAVEVVAAVVAGDSEGARAAQSQVRRSNAMGFTTQPTKIIEVDEPAPLVIPEPAHEPEREVPPVPVGPGRTGQPEPAPAVPAES